ncbi:cytochrome C biogenesis protein [Lysobacteraceae bacterium NML120232]|nr:cytochrome C biogenesis protein [Xanthomonadaceae bacterium NML08-0793]PJK13338.1 cytochrome C biogenesis protein [Xanthomonadaceae bacterium NML120232]
MMRALYALLLSLAFCLPHTAHPQVQGDISPPEFRDSFEEARFRALTHELRCVMCQNQSLADSNAEIARDLRNEVLVLLRQGKTDAEIRDFMVARYGEFVLYKPRLQAHTALLWFGPLLLVMVGALAVFFLIRRQAHKTREIPIDEQQEW